MSVPDAQMPVLLFIAGFISWIIGTFSGATGSIALLATLTYVIRVKTIAPVVTTASLMASPTRVVVYWNRIHWPVVRWYLPGAVCGAVLGSWMFTWVSAGWLAVLVGLFLVSTPVQYRLGDRARSFPMSLRWFIPVSVAVGVISGLVGASSLVSMPFYFNYGLTKERMIATGAFHSLFIQIAKMAAYGSLGVLSAGSIFEGVCAGSGAILAIVISRHWLARFSDVWFRRAAVFLMLATGISLVWRNRHIFV